MLKSKKRAGWLVFLLALADSQLRAPLATTGFQDLAARFRARTDEKTVRGCSLLLTWLIGSLRHNNLNYGRHYTLVRIVFQGGDREAVLGANVINRRTRYSDNFMHRVIHNTSPSGGKYVLLPIFLKNSLQFAWQEYNALYCTDRFLRYESTLTRFFYQQHCSYGAN